MSIKKDCFAHISDDRYRGCFCLNELYCCKDGNCSFYKTREVAKKRYLDTYSVKTALYISKSTDMYFRSL